MKVTFDPEKSARNTRERGLGFERAVDFDYETAFYWQDERRDYGEERFVAIGYLDSRLHVLCFTQTADGIRVISFRKANEREAKLHGKQKKFD